MPHDVERPPAPGQPADARKQLFRIGGVVGGLVAVAVLMMLAIFSGAGSESSASNRTQSTENRIMSAEGADDLRARLADNDWRCYDTVDKPVMLKRCYLSKTTRHGEPSTSTLTMMYADAQTLARAALVVHGPAQDDIKQTAARLMGDRLLATDGHTLHQLAEPNPSDRLVQIDGASVELNESTIVLTKPGTSPHELESRFEAAALPAQQQIRSSLQEQGFDCEPTGHDHLDCTREGDNGLQVRASTDAESTHGLGHWTLTADTVDLEHVSTLAEDAENLANVAREAGLTNDQGSAFIRGNTEPHQEADFSGHHVTIDWSAPRDGRPRASDRLTVKISPVDSPVATET